MICFQCQTSQRQWCDLNSVSWKGERWELSSCHLHVELASIRHDLFFLNHYYEKNNNNTMSIFSKFVFFSYFDCNAWLLIE